MSHGYKFCMECGQAVAVSTVSAEVPRRSFLPFVLGVLVALVGIGGTFWWTQRSGQTNRPTVRAGSLLHHVESLADTGSETDSAAPTPAATTSVPIEQQHVVRFTAEPIWRQRDDGGVPPQRDPVPLIWRGGTLSAISETDESNVTIQAWRPGMADLVSCGFRLTENGESLENSGLSAPSFIGASGDRFDGAVFYATFDDSKTFRPWVQPVNLADCALGNRIGFEPAGSDGEIEGIGSDRNIVVLSEGLVFYGIDIDQGKVAWQTWVDGGQTVDFTDGTVIPITGIDTVHDHGSENYLIDGIVFSDGFGDKIAIGRRHGGWMEDHYAVDFMDSPENWYQLYDEVDGYSTFIQGASFGRLFIGFEGVTDGPVFIVGLDAERICDWNPEFNPVSETLIDGISWTSWRTSYGRTVVTQNGELPWDDPECAKPPVPRDHWRLIDSNVPKPMSR